MADNTYMPTFIKNKMLLDGYVFNRSKPAGNTTYYKCRRVPRKECTATAVTKRAANGVTIVTKGPRESPHEHPPDQEECQAEIVTDRL